ncbi:HAMP domain-containing sensor histidine kinase [Novosphingobium sp. MD-1]|uniref:sensor histidine kinase n=1 Tax=Novosphingobium sp. MD-1 TaxID=1630648 RepID=UPI00061BA52C|nr:ATP-binding protein [Novosphingobium sp. MD-1]GAO54028.1 integral membrane sensor signal transduction histidine kinase [Novosphingobium sp. MD-1]
MFRDLPRAFSRFVPWPRSLQGQMLFAIAIALLIAQSLSAALIWRAQHERHVGALVNSAAFRLLGPPLYGAEGGERGGMRRDRGPEAREGGPPGAPGFRRRPPPPDDGYRLPRPLRVRVDNASPEQPGDRRIAAAEKNLTEVLENQGVAVSQVVVLERDPHQDSVIAEWWEQQRHRFAAFSNGEPPPRLVIASFKRSDGTWLSARVLTPAGERQLLISLLWQTVLLYLVLIGAVALILRRIAQPLKALTRRVEDFARDRSIDGQLVPGGPEDIRRLIEAHNAMEARIAGLLDEKDVMLGAIGHDLKTPLAALRVRIEAVEDDAERGRMAKVIEDINRSLDDILSLARVGRPSDPLEMTELSALVADVADEFEDMGEDVTLGDTARIVLPVRATWLRRAMRNLVSNALRYGQRARVSLVREGNEAVLRIEDDGPGIPEGEIARMMEPFTRLEASRNTATGGTGLGLTLARAIADQHGGSLVLANRVEAGRIAGLVATLRLPVT